ncbi:DUF3293 domain-containing protein [Candidatus Methylospira mobilis]|uniref:DUF3293 domain-containing protein n=1 Tax=Candidatus Methylospira mobilis TaxID=1808979 RepID=A0A5Q0BLR7_9GAMM|nr:DUF3293 domain-containing protein [Candidatus Methylospira mobilis]QFY43164.1 DUF3293 domain-containing protein [Candidatus Methylospira mobilis]WNV03633.1 DUF3293 domain-containing protein [Candidatus Methylospira mobilis]
MNRVYFDTHFERRESWEVWPAEFAIITAYATTGETWPDSRNLAADRQLEAELRRQRRWMRRLTGFSPADGHAEPGWAVDIGFHAVCDIGKRYEQDAIYYIIEDTLYVSFCDQRRALLEVGGFRVRVHP